MTLEQLRLIHPRLIYRKYAVSRIREGVEISYEYLLEPDILFRPKVVIPYFGKVDERSFALYAFHLGLVESISYWKAACPREFVVEAGALTEEQTRFWHDLFIHGLGEFFYRNSIDFTVSDFLTIRSVGSGPIQSASDTFVPGTDSDLVLVGGGKDSAATMGILKQSDRTLQAMILNPTKAALDTVRAFGLSTPLVVRRTIDEALLTLNTRGYLNGHTPFSAYLAFLGVTVAMPGGYEHVIVSNEKSANEGNVMYRGLEVNHQYSKSFRFEQRFREYCARTFVAPAGYFSIMRPLNDIQISLLFSGYPEYFPAFRSCNVGSKSGVWCGTCPKCAFTFLTLSPFLSQETLLRIFGSDYFQNDEIIEHIYALVGLRPVKPFECVGTRDEAKLAVYMAVSRYMGDGSEIPEGLLKIKSDIALSASEVARLKEAVIDNWGDTYNVPSDHLTMLSSAWERARTSAQGRKYFGAIT